MDVTTPPIPAEYDGYRETLRAFVAEHAPVLSSRQRTGLRVPDDAEDVSRLRDDVGPVRRGRCARQVLHSKR